MFIIFSRCFSSLWHWSARDVLSFHSLCFYMFLNTYIYFWGGKFFVQKKKTMTIKMSWKALKTQSLVSSLSLVFCIFLLVYFLTVGVSQHLACVNRSVRNELEAKSRPGQLLSLPDRCLLFSCGLDPTWPLQPKKDKGTKNTKFIRRSNNSNDWNKC